MTTPRLHLETWDAGNTQPDLVFNEMAYTVDALLQLSVVSRALNTPPVSPAVGDAYIVGSAPTDAWIAHVDELAVAVDDGWTFYIPQEGWQAWSVADGARYDFSGSGGWVLDASSGIPDAPSDGTGYVRKDAGWVAEDSGLPDAPSDGTGYVRKDAAWVAESGGGGGVAWGGITGTLSDQMDLQDALDAITGATIAIQVAISDETTDLTTGTAKITFRAPYAFILTDVRASLSTASSSGTPTFDINMDGTSILLTKITIDSTERTSTTAAIAPTILTSAITDDAEITIDIDTAGTGARGAKITMIGTQT